MKQEVPDGWTLVPKEPDDWIAAHIPAETADEARDIYRRIVAAAELSGGASIRVRGWSCHAEADGKARCAQWCRSPTVCVASCEVTHRPVLPSPTTEAQT